MPSIILHDFFGDTKIELQLAHKSSVDDKNLDMINKVFGEIVKLKKENEKLKKAKPTTDPIKDCMNDIINQVETREWKRVNDHRERVVKKMKNQSQKIENWKTATREAEDRLDEQMLLNENMKDDWVVATEKIGQENSDLHNEIKRLKDELRVKHPVIFQKTYQRQRDEIKLLKGVNKLHLQKLEHMEKSKSGIRYKELLDENEKLKNLIDK
jgi:hypothetical protein